MIWQAKLKAWAVGLGLTAASLGGTGYLATTGVGQGPPAPGAGPDKAETPAAKATAKLRKLREDRAELARIYWGMFSKGDLQRKGVDFPTAHVLLATAFTMSHAVVEAELEVATTPTQRADAWKAQIERVHTIGLALRDKVLLDEGSGLLDAELVAMIRLAELDAK